MAVYIFLGLLTLLFAINVVILLPLQKPVDIGLEGMDSLREQGRDWYVLNKDSYSVDTVLSSIHIRSSFVPLLSNEYTYYCITVNPEQGPVFSMPVRVRTAKRQSFERGETVKLYGMTSSLNDEMRIQMEAANHQVQLKYICLNDNGDTILKRCFSSGIFALAAALCIAWAIKIAKRH